MIKRVTSLADFRRQSYCFLIVKSFNKNVLDLDLLRIAETFNLVCFVFARSESDSISVLSLHPEIKKVKGTT